MRSFQILFEFESDVQRVRVRSCLLLVDHALLLPLIFCKFEYDNYKFMQCILFRCLKCTKFAQLILRKIVKIVATSCQILRQMHHIRFRLGLRPRPRWDSAPQTP